MDEIKELINKGGLCLIGGVSGSGKTSLISKMVVEAYKSGLNVGFAVYDHPTTTIKRRLKSHLLNMDMYNVDKAPWKETMSEVHQEGYGNITVKYFTNGDPLDNFLDEKLDILFVDGVYENVAEELYYLMMLSYEHDIPIWCSFIPKQTIRGDVDYKLLMNANIALSISRVDRLQFESPIKVRVDKNRYVPEIKEFVFNPEY